MFLLNKVPLGFSGTRAESRSSPIRGAASVAKSREARIPRRTWASLCWQGDQTLLFQPSQLSAGATVVRVPADCVEHGMKDAKVFREAVSCRHFVRLHEAPRLPEGR